MRALLVLLASTSLAACAWLGMHDGAGGAGASRSAQQDAGYLREISEANLAATAAGRLAAAKAQSLALKQFARWMIDEHVALEAKAQELERAKGLAPASALGRREQAMLDDLRALAGERFERAYLQRTVEDHVDALQVLDEAATQANDPGLRTLAAQAAVHARQHLAEARRLAGDVVGLAR